VDYLLLYHPSAAASLEAAKEKSEGSVELRAWRDGEALVVQNWSDGWLVPGVEVTVHWPGTELTPSATTDIKGEVRFAWPGTLSSGFVGVRAKVVEVVSGESEGKKYTQKHHWATLTFPSGVQEPLSRRLSGAFRKNHEIVAGSAFNVTLFQGQLTRKQAEIHLQQRALVHNEVHRILTEADLGLNLPYGPAQKAPLTLLFSDLIAMGSGWPTEAQARPLTQAFLEELRESQNRGPYFALGVHHVYYGGTTNGGRMIGQKLTQAIGFSPTYYAQSGGYLDYLREVDKITSPEAQTELLRGGQAAYRYILAAMNEKVFQHE
jgi:heme oxygenase